MIALEQLLRLEKDHVYDFRLIAAGEPYSEEIVNHGVIYRMLFDHINTGMATGSPLRMEMFNPVKIVIWGSHIPVRNVPGYINNETEDGVRFGLFHYLVDSVSEVE